VERSGDKRGHLWEALALAPPAAVVCYYLARTRGFFDGDDVARYLAARYLPANAAGIVSLWNRPVFILLYSVPARFGHEAALCLSAALAVAAMGLTLCWAKGLSLRYALLAPALLVVQPYFLHLSTACLTEMLFAATLAFSLLAFSRGKFAAAAVSAALLPLVRPEGVVAMGIIEWFIIRRSGRKVTPVVAGAVPLLAWQLAGWAVWGDFLWAFRQAAYTGEFGRADALFFFRRGILAFGPVVTSLALVALFTGSGREEKKRPSLDAALAVAAALFALYVILVWKPAMGNPAAFLRFFVTFSPVVAVLAAHGLEVTFNDEKRPWIPAIVFVCLGAWVFVCSRALPLFEDAFGVRYALFIAAPLGGVAVLSAARRIAPKGAPVFVSLAVVAALGWTLKDTPPRKTWPEQLAARRAVRWWAGSPQFMRPARAKLKHLVFRYYMDEMGFGARALEPLEMRAVESAPPGEVFILEGRESEREFYRRLASSRGVELVKDFSIPGYILVFFQKASPEPRTR